MQNYPEVGNTMQIISYLSGIIYCMADGQYTHFFLVNRQVYTASKLLKDVEEILAEQVIFRTNRQFLINLKHVVSFDKDFSRGDQMINGTEISVAIGPREQLLDLLYNW